MKPDSFTDILSIAKLTNKLMSYFVFRKQCLQNKAVDNMTIERPGLRVILACFRVSFSPTLL